ncbi:MAG: hypothetical protein WAN65_01210, partial [Candidatus Sulfotelmatobacter sp.]
FFALDPSPKLDINTAAFPRGEWSRVKPAVRARTNRGRQHADRVNSDPTNTPTVAIADPKRIN